MDFDLCIAPINFAATFPANEITTIGKVLVVRRRHVYIVRYRYRMKTVHNKHFPIFIIYYSVWLGCFAFIYVFTKTINAMAHIWMLHLNMSKLGKSTHARCVYGLDVRSFKVFYIFFLSSFALRYCSFPFAKLFLALGFHAALSVARARSNV